MLRLTRRCCGIHLVGGPQLCGVWTGLERRSSRDNPCSAMTHETSHRVRLAAYTTVHVAPSRRPGILGLCILYILGNVKRRALLVSASIREGTFISSIGTFGLALELSGLQAMHMSPRTRRLKETLGRGGVSCKPRHCAPLQDLTAKTPRVEQVTFLQLSKAGSQTMAAKFSPPGILCDVIPHTWNPNRRPAGVM